MKLRRPAANRRQYRRARAECTCRSKAPPAPSGRAREFCPWKYRPPRQSRSDSRRRSASSSSDTRRGIHQRKELTGRRLVAGNDAVRVMRTMLIDESNRLFDGIHRMNRHRQRQILAPPVAFVRRFAGYARRVERRAGTLVRAQGHVRLRQRFGDCRAVAPASCPL